MSIICICIYIYIYDYNIYIYISCFFWCIEVESNENLEVFPSTGRSKICATLTVWWTWLERVPIGEPTVGHVGSLVERTKPSKFMPINRQWHVQFVYQPFWQHELMNHSHLPVEIHNIFTSCPWRALVSGNSSLCSCTDGPFCLKGDLCSCTGCTGGFSSCTAGLCSCTGFLCSCHAAWWQSKNLQWTSHSWLNRKFCSKIYICIYIYAYVHT